MLSSERFSSRVWGIPNGLTGVLILFLFAGCTLFPDRPKPEPPPKYLPEVAGYIPAYRALDRRPYEFIWANRMPHKDHLVDFEGLLGWRVEHAPDAAATFTRSQTVQLWDQYVGAVQVTRSGPDGWVRLIPPDPIIIRERFNAMECWGNLSAASEPVELTAWLETTRGQRIRATMGSLAAPGWMLLQTRIDSSSFEDPDYPLSLVALELSGLPTTANSTVYLDGLSAYVERLDPIRAAPRPRRGLEPKDGQLLGANTGEGTLPFPDRPSTIIPASPADVRVSAFREEGPGQFAVNLETGEGRWSFRIKLRADSPRVTAQKNGGPAHELLAGLSFPGAPDEAGPLLVQRVEPNELYLEYQRGESYRFSLQGRSLVLDIALRGGAARELNWQGPEPGDEGRYLSIPFLNTSDSPLAQVMVRPAPASDESALFTSVLWAPYRSNASSAAPGSAVALGRTLYAPASNGRRNDLLERLIFTVSTRLEDVLPVIPNPQATHRSEMADRLWLLPDEPFSYDAERERLEEWSAIGLTNVILALPPTIWQEKQESRSLRVRANPFRGGDEALRTFIEDVESTGYWTALYLNCREISPLNAAWSPDLVLRDSDMNWVFAGPSAYALKPLSALNWALERLPGVVTSFPARAVYLDAYSSDPPWRYTDYDFRAPGAATFSQALYADGEGLLRHADILHGPVIAQAEQASFYAGLADGLVCDSGPDSLALRPYLPVYALNEIKPRSIVFGAGPPPSANNMDSDRDVDRYLADQWAYGHAGRVITISGRPDLTARSVYMMRAIQQRTIGLRPARIAYGTELGYISVSEALASGEGINSRLYLQYPGDLECWVNGSETDWTIKVAGANYTLPPSGWLAQAPDFFEFSGTLSERRMDFMQDGDEVFMDGRGWTTWLRGYSAAGPTLFRRTDDGWEILDLLQSGSLALPPDTLIPDRVRVRCFDRAGKELENGRVETGPVGHLIYGPTETMRYVLEPDPTAEEALD